MCHLRQFNWVKIDTFHPPSQQFPIMQNNSDELERVNELQWE